VGPANALALQVQRLGRQNYILPQKAAELSAPGARRVGAAHAGQALVKQLGGARGALRLALCASSGRMPAGYTVGAALGFLTVLYSNGVRQRAHA
jgi:hypothetical protein